MAGRRGSQWLRSLLRWQRRLAWCRDDQPGGLGCVGKPAVVCDERRQLCPEEEGWREVPRVRNVTADHLHPSQFAGDHWLLSVQVQPLGQRFGLVFLPTNFMSAEESR